jgi:hypothetical protein
MAAASHRGLDVDPTAAVVKYRDASGRVAGHDAGGQDDRARFDGFVRQVHEGRLDRAHGGGSADIGSPPLQHARR